MLDADMVATGEVADDETMTKLSLMIGGGGAIRTETFRVFTEDEIARSLALCRVTAWGKASPSDSRVCSSSALDERRCELWHK
jgi:hypothetical protein